MYLGGSTFNKINFCFIKNILKQNWLFLKLFFTVSEEYSLVSLP